MNDYNSCGCFYCVNKTKFICKTQCSPQIEHGKTKEHEIQNKKKKNPMNIYHNLGLFPSFSIFSIKLNQFVIVWNWFVLKLFCFRFSLLKKGNKIRIVKSMNPQPKFWCTNITSKFKCRISIVINKP